ncbi:glycosyltransferase [Pannus brasiliensis CCIBt3594]|uniref:Glycosyltransferase n=1 Tax=Pannus brasiliensis CCIBt3594 TaxID=1427578 RepID=A0AAW9QQC2_9CHRO
MRILIIAYYFPPETYATMASLRPYSWAKYWHRSGHEICILTTPKNRDEVEKHPWTNVHIEEVPLPVLRAKNLSGEKDLSTEKKAKRGNLRERLIALQKNLGAGSLLYGSNLWIFNALGKAIELHRQQPFDVVVSTYSPPASPIVAGILKRKFDIFWVADYRDLWHDNAYTRAKFPFAWIEDRLENYYVGKADLITTVSEPLAAQLARRFRQPIRSIENGFDLEELPEERYLFPDNGKIRVAYTGSIYPGKQDPSPLFQAIQELGTEKNRLEILFYTFESDYLNSLISRYNLHGVVQINSFINRIDCLQIQKTVDLLLFLDWNDPTTEGILTGKIFEYMYSGVPVLALGSDRGTVASQLIQEAGIGVCLGNSSKAIADFLRDLVKGIRPDYNPDRNVLQRYTREKLAATMLEEIQKHQKRFLGENR